MLFCCVSGFEEKGKRQMLVDWVEVRGQLINWSTVTWSINIPVKEYQTKNRSRIESISWNGKYHERDNTQQ